MLKRYFALFFVAIISFSSQAAPIDQSDPYVMMRQVAEHSFQRLKAEQEQIHADPNYLKVIVEEELMPYVNDQYAALKLLGTHLKGADRNHVLAFAQAFRAYLVTSYAQVLTQYSDQEIVFGRDTGLDEDRRISSVKVDIIEQGRPPIKLEFKLRKEKSGDWFAFDMIAEGISLLSSKQSEWSSKIRTDGIMSVAKELQILAEQPIRFEGNAQ